MAPSLPGITRGALDTNQTKLVNSVWIRSPSLSTRCHYVNKVKLTNTICLCLLDFSSMSVWSSHKSPWSAVVHSWHLKPPISRNSLEVCWSIIPSLDTGQSLSCPPNITMIRWEIESFRESRLSPSSRAVDAALMFYINPLAPPSNIFSIKNWIFFPSPLSFPLSIHHRLWNSTSIPYPFQRWRNCV